MLTINTLTDLLRHRKSYIERSLHHTPDSAQVLSLTITALLCFAAYGFIIGASHSPLQSLVSAVKLPFLFLITAAICFPTLYFFLVLLGAKQSLGQLLSFIITCLAIMGLVLVVFAPVSLFFLITTNSYFFYKLLNVAIFGTAGFVGLYFFYQNLQTAVSAIEDEQNQRRAKLFLRLWLLMFAFIGCQLSYSLSPFFGFPQEPFILFTKVQSNFYTDVVSNLFGRRF